MKNFFKILVEKFKNFSIYICNYIKNNWLTILLYTFFSIIGYLIIYKVLKFFKGIIDFVIGEKPVEINKYKYLSIIKNALFLLLRIFFEIENPIEKPMEKPMETQEIKVPSLEIKQSLETQKIEVSSLEIEKPLETKSSEILEDVIVGTSSFEKSKDVKNMLLQQTFTFREGEEQKECIFSEIEDEEKKKYTFSEIATFLEELDVNIPPLLTEAAVLEVIVELKLEILRLMEEGEAQLGGARIKFNVASSKFNEAASIYSSLPDGLKKDEALEKVVIAHRDFETATLECEKIQKKYKKIIDSRLEKIPHLKEILFNRRSEAIKDVKRIDDE